MKVGDLVKVIYLTPDEKQKNPDGHGKIAMVVEGPNEVGKVRVILPNGKSLWKHCSEVEYMPKDSGYLKK